jgi:four helix bundle protein
MNAERETRNAEQQASVAAPFDLQERTRQFALAVLRLVETFPRGRAATVIGYQLLRSATSVGANYRAARRARSRRDFVAKMGIVEEEADESVYWLELSVDARLGDAAAVESLRREAGELLAITVSSIRTAREGLAAVPRSAFRVPR